MPSNTLPDLITNAQTTEESFLRHIFVRDQMHEWTKQPLVMAKADGVHGPRIGGPAFRPAYRYDARPCPPIPMRR